MNTIQSMSEIITAVYFDSRVLLFNRCLGGFNGSGLDEVSSLEVGEVYALEGRGGLDDYKCAWIDEIRNKRYGGYVARFTDEAGNRGPLVEFNPTYVTCVVLSQEDEE